jgi:hypothetical protein
MAGEVDAKYRRFVLEPGRSPREQAGGDPPMSHRGSSIDPA